MRCLASFFVAAAIALSGAGVHAADASDGELFGVTIGKTYKFDQQDRVKRDLGSLLLVEIAAPTAADDLQTVTLLVTKKSNTVVSISARSYMLDPVALEALAQKYSQQVWERYARYSPQHSEDAGISAPLDQQTVVRFRDDFELRLGTKEVGLREGQRLFMFAMGMMAQGELFERLTELGAAEAWGEGRPDR